MKILKQQLKNSNYGITLTALVITVIVLLILAGVSITSLTGESNIINNALNSKEQQKISEEKEMISLAVTKALSQNVSGILTKSELNSAFNSSFSNVNITVYEDDPNFILEFCDEKRYYQIDSNSNITNIEITFDDSPGNIEIGINGEVLDGDENPFEIWCIEDLVAFSKNYNKYKTSNVNLKQTLNFKSELSYKDSSTTSFGDLNNDGTTESLILELQKGIGFTPINTFNGIFDGEGNEIKNLYQHPSTYGGLFARFGGSKIQNLGVTGSITSSSSYDIGGIVSELTTSSVQFINCHSDIDINSYKSSAGIVGKGNPTIINCYNSGNITSTNGITAGLLASGYATVKNSYNSGTIQSDISYAAGLVGTGNGSMSFENCYNTGDVTSVKPSGGLVGYLYGGSFTVTNCYNTASISASSTSGCGGLMGYINSSLGTTITNSYNTGSITSPDETGGIIGMENSSSTGFIRIDNVYNAGDISGKIIGGLIAYNANTPTVTITNSYNSGTLTSNNYAGGLLSYPVKASGYDMQVQIQNCYNTGSISGNYVGGLLIAQNSIPTIENCYNAGELTITKSTGKPGGLVGFFSSGTGSILNSYYINNQNSAFSSTTVTPINDSYAYSSAQLKDTDFIKILNDYINADTSRATWKKWELKGDNYPSFK